MTDDKLSKLHKQLLELEDAYWNKNAPLVADSVYDALRREYETISKDERPIGVNGEGRKTLPSPMYSLANIFNKEEYNKWIRKVRSVTNDDKLIFIVEMKHDGLSISLYFKDCILHDAYTRGNGIEGDSVKDKIPKWMQELTLPTNQELEIRGELYITKKDFEEINSTLGEDKYSNPRQCAVGILKGSDPKFKDKLTFSCFGMGLGQNWFLSESDMFTNTIFDNIPTTKIYYKGSNASDAFDICSELCVSASTNNLPLDGAVIKVDNLLDRENIGYTSHHPKWAMAIKLKDESYKTKITTVDWTVGVQGTITPTIQFEPVDIEGVKVSKASAANANLFTTIGYAIGDSVWVKRSGDVIPKIVKHSPKAGERVVEKYPETCPACGGKTTLVGAYLKCTNSTSCKGQLIAVLQHFVSRDALNLKGFGAAALYWAIEQGVKSGSDLIVYFRDDTNADNIYKEFGKKISDKLISVCKKSDSYPLKNVIYALAIPSVGSSTAKLLSLYTGSLAGLVDTFSHTVVPNMDNIGLATTCNIMGWFANPTNVDEVSCLDKLIATTVEDEPSLSKDAKTVCFTGSGDGYDRSMLKQSAINAGYKPVGSVTKKLSILVVGSKGASKAKIDKAVSLGITVADTNAWRLKTS